MQVKLVFVPKIKSDKWETGWAVAFCLLWSDSFEPKTGSTQ